MHAQTDTVSPIPFSKALQAARVEAAGVSPSLAVALADLFFPTTKRDDLATLAAVTASRCSAASVGCR